MKKNLTTEKTAYSLKLEKTSKLYTSPKIHKQGNPGRPVVNSINSHASNLPKSVDHCLQQHVQNLPSYVQNITDFIKKIRDTKDDTRNAILSSMDVKSLYKNIPNHDGIETVK